MLTKNKYKANDNRLSPSYYNLLVEKGIMQYVIRIVSRKSHSKAHMVFPDREIARRVEFTVAVSHLTFIPRKMVDKQELAGC